MEGLHVDPATKADAEEYVAGRIDSDELLARTQARYRLPEVVDPYLDPDTGLLRNLVGTQTKSELDAAEGALVVARALQLRDHPIRSTGDLDEFSAIHRHLFQDVYPWPGKSAPSQQTYEWAVRFPDKALRAAPIAGTAQNTPHDFLFTETLNEQIWSDPGWNAGEYGSNAEVVDGLKRHAHLWGTMGFSTEFWKQEKWAALGFASKEAFLSDFLEPYFTTMDPNDLLAMAWKWQRGDVARHTGGDLTVALGRVTAKMFVMPISEDMFFPVRDCAAEQALVPNSELRVIEDVHGHLGLFAVDPGYIPQVDKHLAELLATDV